MTSTPNTDNILLMVENTPPATILAKNICTAMERENLTVTDIARQLKITYEMARRYTLGLARPRSPKLAALAELLRTTPAALEYGDTPNVTFIKRETPILQSQLAPDAAAPVSTPEEMARWLGNQDKQAIAAFLRTLADALEQGDKK